MAEAAAPRPAASVRRPAAQRRPAPSGLPRRARGGGRAPFPAWFRWARVALLVAGLVVGLPVAHAVFGEVVALLGGAAALGFFVGRWTAPPRG
jgi:hypothetical protein